VKIKKMITLLAFALSFSGLYVSELTGQEQQPSGQQSNPAAASKAPSNGATTEGKQLRAPDVVFVPTPQEAVDAMLKVAKVGKEDVVYDLGSGDGDRVRFLNEDLFQANISDATVVTLYLLPSLNLKLLPKLLSELKPGTRIVSHAFDMGTWKPEQTLNAGGSTVYFWTIPAKGTPEYEAASGAANRT
jgi:hypothetical protein